MFDRTVESCAPCQVSTSLSAVSVQLIMYMPSYLALSSRQPWPGVAAPPCAPRGSLAPSGAEPVPQISSATACAARPCNSPRWFECTRRTGTCGRCCEARSTPTSSSEATKRETQARPPSGAGGHSPPWVSASTSPLATAISSSSAVGWALVGSATRALRP
jgi:hypothetical protein